MKRLTLIALILAFWTGLVAQEATQWMKHEIAFTSGKKLNLNKILATT